MFDEALRRRRSAWSPARSPLSVAATPSKLTALIWAITGIAARTAARTTPVAPEAALARAGTTVILSLWPGAITTRPEVPAAVARPGRWAQFIFGQFSVAVLIELFEGGGGVGDFLRGKFAIVIRVERLHERIGTPARPSVARRTLLRTSLVVAAGRPLRVAIVVPLGRTFRGLGNDGHSAERANHADKKPQPKHLTLPVV